MLNVKNDYFALTVSGKACDEQVLVSDGDGDASECVVKLVDEKIRHQMYALTL